MINKKILWIAHEANVSGANICLNEFMSLTAATDLKQVLVLPHTGNMQTHAASLHVPVHIIHFYGWMRKIGGRFFMKGFTRKLLRNLYAVYELVKLIKAEKVTTVFTNTSTFNVGAWAARLSGKKHFWYIHELGAEDFGITVPRGKKSYHFMNTNSEKIYTNSVFLKNKLLQKYPPFNLEVLPNPVLLKNAPAPVNWIKGTTFKLLILGQVLKSKGQHIAIEAMRILQNRNYNVTLSIIGSREDILYFEELNVLIQKYDLTKIITFKKFVDDPETEISNHHALLICSICEAFGRVTIEAMKLGVTVIGSNSCGTKEILRDGKTGYLFNCGDSSSLANQVINLIDNPKESRIKKANAQKMAFEITASNHFYNSSLFL